MFKEFREFALRGSLVDLAVGFILGTAFATVITSLVNDILMPPVGLLLGGADFSDLFITLSGGPYASLAAAKAAGAPTINYGLFLNTVIGFIIVAFVLFLVIRRVNRMRSQPAPSPNVRSCPYCDSVISVKARRCPHCTSELKAV